MYVHVIHNYAKGLAWAQAKSQKIKFDIFLQNFFYKYLLQKLVTEKDFRTTSKQIPFKLLKR